MALEILEVALCVSGPLLAPYLLENVVCLMERLGDSKEPVRQQAQDLLLKFMRVAHSSPQVAALTNSHAYMGNKVRRAA